MDETMSCCGMVCKECASFPDECQGCSDLRGEVFWLQYVDAEVCPVYECCVTTKGYRHCGHCGELPCERYSRFSDPNVTEEEAAACLQKQLRLLRSL